MTFFLGFSMVLIRCFFLETFVEGWCFCMCVRISFEFDICVYDLYIRIWIGQKSRTDNLTAKLQPLAVRMVSPVGNQHR